MSPYEVLEIAGLVSFIYNVQKNVYWKIHILYPCDARKGKRQEHCLMLDVKNLQQLRSVMSSFFPASTLTHYQT